SKVSSGLHSLRLRRCFSHLPFAMARSTRCAALLQATEQYYGIDESTVFLLLNWGGVPSRHRRRCVAGGLAVSPSRSAIILIPTVPVVSWVSSRPGGLRLTVRFAVIVMAFGAALRCVPSVRQPRGGKR